MNGQDFFNSFMRSAEREARYQLSPDRIARRAVWRFNNWAISTVIATVIVIALLLLIFFATK